MTATIDYTALWREDATEDEMLDLYQHLVNTGEAWTLEGHVGRTAHALIESKRIALGVEPCRDFWGNRVPSRDEIEPGYPGAAEFAREVSA